jgi:2-polyprenyl-6-hydroxyphenyl methylase/3-demethylubiquinone-9 3-methyltransferase
MLSTLLSAPWGLPILDCGACGHLIAQIPRVLAQSTVLLEPGMAEFGDTVDPEDLDRFAAHGASWWDPSGSFGPLHQINPLRVAFIRRELLAHFQRDARSLAPFTGLSLADIGCGGGLVAEPMTRLGCTVTGIDAGAEAIDTARAHAEAGGLGIDYRVADIEALAGAGERYDIVLALEILEHVADRDAFFAALGMLVKPGGLFIGATLNRTARSFALAIVGAEYILGWLPRGTHDWRRFVRPSEFVLGLRRAGLAATRLAGLAYDWRSGGWSESQDLSVNYMLAAARR